MVAAPFIGFNAWFSNSVQSDIIKQWSDHGGEYSTQETADYLFSESATSNDTLPLYNDNTILIIHPEFITNVIKEKRSVADIPITQYILLPMIKPPIISTPPINKESTPLIKETTPIQIRKKLIPKLTSRQYRSSSTHVTYHTKDANIKDIVHVDSLGIINERLVTAAPNMNGIVVTKIP